MKSDLVARVYAARKVISKALVVAFKLDFFDATRECFMTKALTQFISNVQMVRDSTRADDDLAKAMGAAKL
jgi:hypothetical protein